MENKDDSFLVTNIVNFSSEELPELPNVHIADANDTDSISVEVDLFILIEPDLEWLKKNLEVIKSREALTLMLTKNEDFDAFINFPDVIDKVIFVDDASCSELIVDIIMSLNSNSMMSVDFGDFRFMMRQGNEAMLLRGDYTKHTEFDDDYLYSSFLSKVSYENVKSLFVLITFSFDYICDLDDFADVASFFRNEAPEGATVAVTTRFTNDVNGARVSAILVA